jgi:hypothetical protein
LIAIAVGQTYTVGSSWTVGGGIGLSFEKIIGGSATLSAEVSQSIEISVTSQVENECPPGGDFSCAMLIYPGMKRVKGHMEFLIPGGDCPMGPSVSDGDWEMIAPRKDKSNLGYFTPELCTCVNLQGADGPNHPEKSCIEDFVDPN